MSTLPVSKNLITFGIGFLRYPIPNKQSVLLWGGGAQRGVAAVQWREEERLSVFLGRTDRT